ncbi:MAG: hypothetical protein QOJ56_5413 [Mycobacterium sp.]|nr:hypothetical protein [Mycobacterium sp.]
MKRTPEGQRLIDELDAELAASAAQAGRTLSWSAAERAIIAMAADAVDRRVDLAASYESAGDVKDRIKIGRELRLMENATARLLAKISTAAPVPETLRSVKARRAANARWRPGCRLIIRASATGACRASTKPCSSSSGPPWSASTCG